MTTSEQLQKEIEQLRFEIEMLKKLGTRMGFFNFYFNQLQSKKFRTNLACFDYVNELHFNFYGVYRYSDYNTFRKQFKSIFKNENI